MRRHRFTRMKLIAAATIVAGMTLAAAPARADAVVYTIDASNCLPGGIVCARITMDFHYQATGSLGTYTFRTTARGSALALPGTLEARKTIRVVDPPDPDPFTVALKCGWDLLGGGCGLTFPDQPTGQFPFTLCAVVRFDLSATARAIDDPVLRLLPVNARAIRDLKLCWDGTVTPA